MNQLWPVCQDDIVSYGCCGHQQNGQWISWKCIKQVLKWGLLTKLMNFTSSSLQVELLSIVNTVAWRSSLPKDEGCRKFNPEGKDFSPTRLSHPFPSSHGSPPTPPPTQQLFHDGLTPCHTQPFVNHPGNTALWGQDSTVLILVLPLSSWASWASYLSFLNLFPHLRMDATIPISKGWNDLHMPCS